MTVTPANHLVIRLNPPEFWSATRLMSETERNVLLEAITRLAEAGDVEGLSHFNFVSISARPEPQAA